MDDQLAWIISSTVKKKKGKQWRRTLRFFESKKIFEMRYFGVKCKVLHDHLLLDRALNLGPLISRWEITKFQNCWYKSVRFLEVLKLLFHQFLNLSRSQRDMSGPRLGDLSNNRGSGVCSGTYYKCIIPWEFTYFFSILRFDSKTK